MEKHELTPLQTNLLAMMKWLDAFCRDNNLRYYAIGGTMIGAARHHGFIPWDDDIDICMPRKDYEMLIKLMGDKVHDKYVLETPKTNAESYCYPYAKLYDTTTTLIENYKTPLVRGTFIDVFQLDGLGDSEEDAKKFYIKQRRKYSFYVSRVTAIRKDRPVLKNIIVVLARLIPKFIINNRNYRMMLDNAKGVSDFDNSLWASYLYGNWGIREVMTSDIFGTPKDYEFEDMTICGVEKADEYLTRVYGDWRKLPPKEKQITHHDYLLLDLEKGF